jgi:hypothetical protein
MMLQEGQWLAEQDGGTGLQNCVPPWRLAPVQPYAMPNADTEIPLPQPPGARRRRQCQRSWAGGPAGGGGRPSQEGSAEEDLSCVR